MAVAFPRTKLMLWLCWIVLVFGAMNIYSRFHRADDILATKAGQSISERGWTLDFFLQMQRPGSDVSSYFAYANASLGRPYEAGYIVLTNDPRPPIPETTGGVATPSGALLPWRDFRVEYPPGMLLAAVIPALFTSDFDTYFLLFCLEMEAALTIAVVLAVRTADTLTPGSGRNALAQSILLAAALGSIAVRRYDASVALAIAATFYGLATRRPILTGVALALGVALKGVPLLLAPIVVIWYATRRDWRGLARAGAAASLTGGAISGLYLLIAGQHALDAFAYHADRPLQVESSFGGVFILLREFFPKLISVTFTYGSDNVVSAAEPWVRRLGGILEVLAFLAVYALAYSQMTRAKDDRQRTIAAVSAAGACLAAFVILGKVFSAQYMTWFIPLGAVAAAASGRGVPWRLVIANAFTQADFPYLYLAAFGANKLSYLFGLVIVARSFSLWRWGTKLLVEPVTPLSSTSAPASEQAADAPA